jgi:beta propeller repeat protein
MYDLSTKKTTQITTSKSHSERPVIYDNTIVWDDSRNGNSDIYAYDLVTHQQIHTTDKSDQYMPAIYGNKVVWTDSRNGNSDIYMGAISFLPVAAFTASPTSGTHPLNVKFNDNSTDAYYWSWDFGDKTTSTLSSPTHKYSKAGKYSVTLSVKNAAGKNTTKKSNFITVK